MRSLLFLVLLLLILPLSLAQSYRPKPGETVLKIEIEGRGDVFVRLYTREAPLTTAHVMRLVRQGFYRNQRFHRVDRNPRPYLVQVGDPGSVSGDLSSVGQGGSGARIPYEKSGFSHVEGAVGLARTIQDADSGDSQFYITLGPAKFLDNKYTVFGQVVAGMDVVQKIERGDRVTSISVLSG